MTALESFALLATLLCGVGLYLAPQYYYHYGDFEAPFIALLYASVAVRLRRRVLRHAHGAGSPPSEQPVGRRRRVGAVAICAVPLLLIAAMAEVRIDVIAQSPRAPQARAVAHLLPSRGCILYANPAVGLLADHFTADVRGCPSIVDYLAEERVLDHGIDQKHSDVKNKALQHTWLRTVKASEAVLVGTGPTWGRTVWTYVHAEFHLLPGRWDRYFLYVRNSSTGG
jgi:hypothetical protein